jgi:hypothetical protein
MTSEAKMGFLHTKLTKDCGQVIAGLFPDDEGYAEALMLLRDRYGHPIMLQAARLQALKSLAPIDMVSQENLSLKFQSFVDRARSQLAVLRRYCKGESPFVSSLIYELTDKLPQDDSKAWRTKVSERQVAMKLGEFSTWLGTRGRSYWSALPPSNINRDHDTIEEETGDLCTIKEKLPSIQNAVVTTRQRTVFNLRNCQSKTG